MGRDLTLADGQVSTTAASIFAGTSAPPSGRIDAILSNTATLKQTLTLTFQVGGGTARRLGRAELEKNEQCIVRGLPVQGGDTLLASTTGAEAVDYLIMASQSQGFSVSVYQADGAPKQSSDITVTTVEKSGLTKDGIVLSGLLEEMRDLLLKIAN